MGDWDWNGDGKYDERDDSLFVNVIDKQPQGDAEGFRQPSRQPQPSRSKGWVVNLLCVVVLFFLFETDSFSGDFGPALAVICLGCIVRLGYSLLRALFS